MNGEKVKWKLNNPANILLPVFLFIVLENFYNVKVATTVSLTLATVFLISSYCRECRKKEVMNWWNMIYVIFAIVIASFILKFVDIGNFNLILPDAIILFLTFIIFLFRKCFTNLIVSNYRKYAIRVHVNLNLLFTALGLTSLILVVYIISFFIERYSGIPNRFFGIGKLILFLILWSYITLKVYFLKNYLSEEEYWPILNEKGNAIGYESKEHVYISKKNTAQSSKNIHPVIRILLIFDNKLLLKKYDSSDFYYPGKWDISISGHLLYGETFESCISRLLKSKFNINENNTRHLLKYTYENDNEYQQVFLNYMHVNDKMMQKADLSNIKPWTASQISDELDSNIFTDKLKKEIFLLKDLSFPYLFDQKN
ncbi:MAG: hypothetical protein LBR52_06695 [Prevotellaceae bacterium]|jgi:hypothetical protein|nr:hypothetical protein [Prevotellaceae bacterium]